MSLVPVPCLNPRIKTTWSRLGPKLQFFALGTSFEVFFWHVSGVTRFASVILHVARLADSRIK